MYYKLRQRCAKNWDSFVLLQIRANNVTNCGIFITTNCDKCCYKLGQLLQIGNRYYKIGQLLQIGTKFITSWGRYYKLWQSLQIEA